MAFYENLMSDQPWQFRTDAWFSDDFSEATDTPKAALQSSFSVNSSNGGDVFSAESLFANPTLTRTVSGASENEIAVSKPRRGGVRPSGRVAKSRVSKRSSTTTTFISADPANFMRMVQQVTGVRLDEDPEGVNWTDGLLPMTLDTSQAATGGGSAANERLPDSFGSFPTLESWKAT